MTANVHAPSPASGPKARGVNLFKGVPSWLWPIVALAILIRTPVLGAGFVSDDYLLLAGAEGRSPLANTPFDLWTFYDGVPSRNAKLVFDGALPWWTEPTASHAFYRPLSSALFTAARAVFGTRAAPYHALLLVLCAYNVWIVGLLFLRLLSRWAAMLGCLFFAVHVLHAGAALWVSTLHLSLCTALGLTGFWFHVRWRSEGLRPGRFVSVACFALGLAAGEAGLMPLAYVVAYELLSGATPRQGRRSALAVPLALVLVYAALYRALGGGAHAIDGYLDPGESIARTLSTVASRLVQQLPRLVTAPSEAMLSDFGERVPPAVEAVVAAAVVVLAAVVLAVDREARRPVAWWLAGGVLAALPALLGPTDRGLYASTVGTAAALGTLASSGWQILATGGRSPVVVRAVAALAGSILVLGQGGLAALSTFHAARRMAATSADQLEAVSALKVPVPEESTDVLVLLAEDQARGPWGGVLYAFASGRGTRSWQALSMAREPHRLVRLADNAFDLEAGGMNGFAMHLYRNAGDHPMRAGDRVTTRGLSIEVMEVSEGRPMRIRVQAEKSFDDPSWCFASRWEGKLVRVRLPPLGRQAVLL